MTRVGFIGRRSMVALLSIAVWGCWGDKTDDFPSNSNDAGDNDSTDDSDTIEIGDPCEQVEQGNYDEWETGNDSFAAGLLFSVTNEDNHKPGWHRARCHECHGLGRPFEVASHDPGMDCWAWSCARGFPGGSCHGHGPNTEYQFNHGDSAEFFGCTQALCHDVQAGTHSRENHGFHFAPDPFCNACHQPNWKGWPDDIVLPTYNR